MTLNNLYFTKSQSEDSLVGPGLCIITGSSYTKAHEVQQRKAHCTVICNVIDSARVHVLFVCRMGQQNIFFVILLIIFLFFPNR